MWLIAEDGTLVNLATVDQVKVLWYERGRDAEYYLAAVTITDGGSNVFQVTEGRPDKSIAEKALQILLRRMLVGGAEGMILCDFRKISE